MIAASEEMHEEKLEFSNLIEHLNEVLKPRGIELKRVKWNPETDGTIEEYKTKLKGCEMCLTLYWKELAGNSEEELNRAYQQLKGGSNPRRLYVFFKEPEEDMTEALKYFKKNFVINYGHFFCKFENVDTMKLHFILQFEAYQNRLNDGQETFVTVKNGKVKIDGKEFVTLDNIPFAALNNEYLCMKDEIAKLDEQLAEASLKNHTNSDDKQQEEYYELVKNKRAELAEKFEKYQNHLYDIALSFAKTSSEHYSQRLLKARELFENGNAIEADLLLNLKELKKEAEREKKQFEQNRDNLELKMAEFRMKTDTIMTNVTLKIRQRIDIVCEAYEEAISIAILIRADEKRADFMLDYAHFCRDYDLFEISKRYYMEVITASQWLTVWNNASPLVLASKAYIGLAMLYAHQKMFKEAEDVYFCTKAVLNKMIEEDNDEVNYRRLAILLNNQSSLHRDIYQYDKALRELEESLKIYDEHIIQCEDTQEKVGILSNLVSVCQKMNQYGKAEKYAYRAYKLACDLGLRKCTKYHYILLSTLITIGQLYLEEHKFGDAEKFFKQADNLFHANEYPEESSILILLLNVKEAMSDLYIKMQRYNEAKIFMEQAKLILKKIKEINPIAIIDVELRLLTNSMSIYRGLKDNDTLKELTQKVFELYCQLDDEQVEAYQPVLASLYFNKGVFMYDIKDFSVATNLCLKALEIFRKLADVQPEVYKKDVAKTLVGLAIMLQESNQRDSHTECERYLYEARDIYEWLAQTAPNVYLPNVADTVYNLACFHDTIKQHNLAMKELQTHQSILKKFVDKTGFSFAYINDLALSLQLMGNIYEWADEDKSAVDCLQESLSYFRMADKANPGLYLHEILDVLFKLAFIMEKDECYENSISIYLEMENVIRNSMPQVRQDLLPEMASILYNRGRLLSYIDSNTSEVLSVINQAKEVYQELEVSGLNYEEEIKEIQDFIDAYVYEKN